MRLLAVVPCITDTSPGQRYRIEQWEPLLRARGVEITYAPFECPELNRVVYQQGRARRKVRLVLQALVRRARLLRRVHEYDAVYLFREAALLGPPVFERWTGSAVFRKHWDVLKEEYSETFVNFLEARGLTSPPVETEQR